MHRYILVFLCLLIVLTFQAHGQKNTAEPIHVAAGTVLAFHLQTRLHPGAGNETDILPKGTVVRVKLLDAIDSNVDRDGSEFRGEVVSALSSGNEIVVHSESQVWGLLALLRSGSHPEGFRYELLLTRVRDHGKSYDLTASLNPSFLDRDHQTESAAKTEGRKVPEGNSSTGEKLPASN